tara:strand:- start:1693 stop:1875 length:183 start_codon:yes stop_codon:yes gene_type:complete
MNNEELYLDWLNNFLTLERFAEYYSMTMADASQAISAGRDDHLITVRTAFYLKRKELNEC